MKFYKNVGLTRLAVYEIINVNINKVETCVIKQLYNITLQYLQLKSKNNDKYAISEKI